MFTFFYAHLYAHTRRRAHTFPANADCLVQVPAPMEVAKKPKAKRNMAPPPQPLAVVPWLLPGETPEKYLEHVLENDASTWGYGQNMPESESTEEVFTYQNLSMFDFDPFPRHGTSK